MKTHGTELTRFDPFWYSDGEGGILVRMTTDEGAVYWRKVSRETALRTIATMARLLSEGATHDQA